MTELTPLLVQALPLAPVQKLHAYPGRREAADLLRHFDAKLCFLDFATAGSEGFATLEMLQAAAPGLVVVALLSGNDPDVVLQCLRAGATDFLVAPFTPDQVEAVIEKVARRIPASDANASSARIVAVMPAKGGCGASSLAANLAFQCKRLGAARVLLADFDGLTGSMSFLLKTKSTYSFVDVLHHAGALDHDIWKQMVVDMRGVDVLLAPDSMVDPTAELVSATPILDFARQFYDVVIADCGGIAGDWNLSIAEAADEVVLVTSNDVPDLHAAQRALVYLEANDIDPDRVRLVLNRYSETIGLRQDTVESALKKEVLQTLPLDEEALEQAQMEGKPIPSGSPVAKGLSTLAKRVLDLDKPSSSKPKSGGLFSLLSRS